MAYDHAPEPEDGLACLLVGLAAHALELAQLAGHLLIAAHRRAALHRGKPQVEVAEALGQVVA